MTDITPAYLDEIERGDIYAVGHVTFQEIIALARRGLAAERLAEAAQKTVRDLGNALTAFRAPPTP